MFQLKKPVRNLIGAGILLALTAALIAAARLLPDFWFSFYPGVSRAAVRGLGIAFGWIPFPVWEAALAALILGVIVWLVYACKKRRFFGWLTGVIEVLALLVFLFVSIWGLNYFGPALKDQIGLEVRAYTETELRQAAQFYARQASEASKTVARDENGDIVLPPFRELAETAAESYVNLGRLLPRFDHPVNRAKPLLVSKAFAYMGTTGVFVCLTGEPTVSTDCFPLAQPFTICHELGHSLAVAAEDEANYCAYLACTASDDPLFRYSGCYEAFIHCFNALHKVNPSAAQKLWALCSDELIHDCNVNITHNQQYEGKVQEAAQAVNDGYLKAFDQPEGVRSYGLVADYLIAAYLAQQEARSGS